MFALEFGLSRRPAAIRYTRTPSPRSSVHPALVALLPSVRACVDTTEPLRTQDLPPRARTCFYPPRVKVEPRVEPDNGHGFCNGQCGHSTSHDRRKMRSLRWEKDVFGLPMTKRTKPSLTRFIPADEAEAAEEVDITDRLQTRFSEHDDGAWRAPTGPEPASGVTMKRAWSLYVAANLFLSSFSLQLRGHLAEQAQRLHGEPGIRPKTPLKRVLAGDVASVHLYSDDRFGECDQCSSEFLRSSHAPFQRFCPPPKRCEAAYNARRRRQEEAERQDLLEEARAVVNEPAMQAILIMRAALGHPEAELDALKKGDQDDANAAA
jgi:hypothetical protein